MLWRKEWSSQVLQRDRLFAKGSGKKGGLAKCSGKSKKGGLAQRSRKKGGLAKHCGEKVV